MSQTECEDWKRYSAAMRTIAVVFGTTVNCHQKDNRLAVDFRFAGLNQEQLAALAVIESLVELVSKFPPGYLEQLEPPFQEHAEGTASEQRSAFSRLRFTNDELPHMEIRALASIGAGLLERNRGKVKAVRKLALLATTFDNYRKNETAKALNVLCEEIAGPGYDDTAEILTELAIRARCAALGLSFAQAQRIALTNSSLESQSLLYALGLDQTTLVPLKARRWLWMAAQSASVSLRHTMTPEILQEVLTTGTVLPKFAPHVGIFLDEGSLPVIVMAIEQAAQQSGVQLATIWRNVAQVGAEVQSRRIAAWMIGS